MMSKKTVRNPHEDILMYELCHTFHKLPSEINSEDYADIQRLLNVHNAVNSFQEKGDKKARREELKKQNRGG